MFSMSVKQIFPFLNLRILYPADGMRWTGIADFQETLQQWESFRRLAEKSVSVL